MSDFCLQQAVLDLQKSDATFLADPPESLSTQYQCWLDIIEDQLSEERLTKQLLASSVLNSKYMEFVPNKVSHQLFWKRYTPTLELTDAINEMVFCRYLFKKALLEDEMARQEISERQKEKQETPLPLAEGCFKWDLGNIM